jgi:two-component system, sensor histidine kinase
MDKHYQILYIEDDVALGRLLQKRLHEKNHAVDLILLDNFLPDLEGSDVLHALQPLDDRPPVILLTASGDERLAVHALEAGAADYVAKDVGLAYIDLLPAVIQAAYTRNRLAQENRQQREELRLAWEKAEAANRAKSAFLAAISHEIRTPLNVIIGATTLLRKAVLDSEQGVLVETLKSNAELLLSLVNDTLDLNKIEAGAMTLEEVNFQAQEIIQAVASLFSTAIKQKGLTFIAEDVTDNSVWEGDILRIKQVVINLMSNAIKFTEEGSITLRAFPLSEGGLAFSVIDTGIGIPKDKQQVIFDSFSQADQSTTREYGGTGLGLTLSRAITHLMEGTLEVQSDPGKGSCFTVNLPLKRMDGICEVSSASKQTDDDAWRTADGQSSANTVLLVEDYPANAMIAEMMLKQMGYQVIWTPSGQEALDAVNKAERPFRAILMDVQMQGMDGYMTTKKIRTLEAKKKWKQFIIGVTAHALQDEVDRCRRAGMNDYMSKPINWDVMEKKLAIL